jgi:hypothetical protein
MTASSSKYLNKITKVYGKKRGEERTYNQSNYLYPEVAAFKNKFNYPVTGFFQRN